MNTPSILIQLIASLAGSFFAVAILYFIVRREGNRNLKLPDGPAAAERGTTSSAEELQLFSLKLQAYERLVIFIERINPANLLPRVYQQGITISELQTLLAQEIRSEYQHNITQQLYVSNLAWESLRKLKEDTLAMINNAAQGLSLNDMGIDLSKRILQRMAEIGDNPYDLSMTLIREELRKESTKTMFYTKKDVNK